MSENDSAVVVTAQSSRSKRYIYPAILIVSIICSGLLGYYLGNKNYVIPLKPDFFTSESATIRGRIIKNDGIYLTVQTGNGTVGKALLNKDIKILKRSGEQSSESVETKSIELNKQAILFLNKTEGVYRVVTIAYL